MGLESRLRRPYLLIPSHMLHANRDIRVYVIATEANKHVGPSLICRSFSAAPPFRYHDLPTVLIIIFSTPKHHPVGVLRSQNHCYDPIWRTNGLARLVTRLVATPCGLPRRSLGMQLRALRFRPNGPPQVHLCGWVFLLSPYLSLRIDIADSVL